MAPSYSILKFLLKYLAARETQKRLDLIYDEYESWLEPCGRITPPDCRWPRYVIWRSSGSSIPLIRQSFILEWDEIWNKSHWPRAGVMVMSVLGHEQSVLAPGVRNAQVSLWNIIEARKHGNIIHRYSGRVRRLKQLSDGLDRHINRGNGPGLFFHRYRRG